MFFKASSTFSSEIVAPIVVRSSRFRIVHIIVCWHVVAQIFSTVHRRRESVAVFCVGFVTARLCITPEFQSCSFG